MAFNFSSISSALIPKLLTLFALAAAFCVSAGTVVFFSLQGKEVQVPKLEGKTEGEAEQILTSNNLRFKVRNRTTSEKYRENLVSEQTPEAGATVKAGQLVSVIISTGIEAKKEPTPTAKPLASPKPKPSVSPTPKDKDKNKDDKTKDAKDKTKPDEKEKSGKDAKDTAPKTGTTDKVTPKPSPKPSLKPTPKPTPRKVEGN